MLEAAIFGAIAQSALIVGALLVWKFPGLKKPVIVGALMAFGAGAIISAVAIDLVAVSYDEAGAGPTVPPVSTGPPRRRRATSPSAWSSTACRSPWPSA